MASTHTHTQIIKAEAIRLGFMACGIAKSGYLEKEAPLLEKWLSNNYHGKMQYMENYFDKRLDTRLLVPDSQSVICLTYNYYTAANQTDITAPKISKYAYGEDYHTVIREKLNALLSFIKETIGDVYGRAFVDSAPVLEKAWAVRSGIGWQGKNANVLTKQTGSFYFLAELIIDLPLLYDAPVADHCGSCTACIDACPTNAILPNAVIDASKCISYLTIELKDEIDASFKGQMAGWAYGCDICQTVCPWNRFSTEHTEPSFNPKPEILDFTKQDWQDITEETFNVIFKNSAVKRTKFKGLIRNIEFLG